MNFISYKLYQLQLQSQSIKVLDLIVIDFFINSNTFSSVHFPLFFGTKKPFINYERFRYFLRLYLPFD